MASISANGSNGNHKFTLTVTETAVSGAEGNLSFIKFTFKLSPVVSSYDWYEWANYIKYTIKVNGVKYTGTIPNYDGVSTVTLKTVSDIEVPHNDDGTKTINFSFSVTDGAGMYYTPGNASKSGSMSLTKIPRYGTCNQVLNAKNETTINMNWSSDNEVDYLWYSTDNGTNWTGVDVTDGTSGIYAISSLNANTTYLIKTRIRRKDSQLTTDSSALSVTTYDYPHITNVGTQNLIIGYSQTLTLYNPLSRTVTIKMLKDNSSGAQLYSGTTSGTSITFEPTATLLYDTIPNAKSSKAVYSCIYSTSTRNTTGNYTYVVDEVHCIPTFTNFTYKDTNSTVTGVTGNDQILVKGLSSLQVTITSANKMVTSNSASPSKYIATIDTLNKSVAYSTSDINLSLGAVANYGTKRLSVTAYDSRSISKTVYKDIIVYNYAKPVINTSISRLNNFEAQTTIKVSGTYTRLNINGTDKNSITSVQYRYRESGGAWGTWTNLVTTVTAGKFTCTDAILSLDNTKSFEFEIRAIDKLSSNTATGEVGTGQAIFFISTNKKACYINDQKIIMYDVVDTENNTIKLQDNTYWDISSILKNGATLSSIINGYGEIATLVDGDYNSMCGTRSGLYRSATVTNAPYTQNAQTSGSNWFYLLHIAHSETYQLQIASPFFEEGLYFRTNKSGSWTAWKQLEHDTLNSVYPVGSVYVSSSNTNPSEILGGTWELVDKEFKTQYINSTELFTVNSTNATFSSAIVVLGGHTLRMRIVLENNVTLNDTNKELGTINLAKIGVSRLIFTLTTLAGFSDDASISRYQLVHNTGVINHLAVIGGTSVASGATLYIDFTLPMTAEYMLDDFCDKFYFKRTA